MPARNLVSSLAPMLCACLCACATVPEARLPETRSDPASAPTPAPVSTTSTTSTGPAEVLPTEPAAAGPALPSLARWHAHVTQDLLPFWTHPDASGTPAGNYPTFRCNDGTAYRAEAPCPELTMLSWVRQELGTEYTRMKSRQAFTYGVGYHLTGDERLLSHARAGVEYLRRHAYDPATGSAVSYWRDGQPGPPPGQRTSQDLAYAQVGLAFYYYLTRDPEVLADLLRLEDHIFSRYYEPSWGMLRWVLEEGEAGRPEQQELVAQLDQINAYLLLVAPLLDEPQRSKWLRHTHDLAHVVATRFFAPAHGLFWGAIHDPARMQLGTRHTDFGHSIKALLMVYLTGTLTHDPALARSAKEHAEALLARAFAATAEASSEASAGVSSEASAGAAPAPSGCWASNVLPDGSMDRWSNWWTFAELDQAAAVLALADRASRPTLQRYLSRSYGCWLERFVDPAGGEVWPFVPPPDWTWEDGQAPEVMPPKAFHWKSGYHSMEHALIAMITTAGLTGEPMTLYYAFRQPPPRARIRPYIFQGTIAEDTAHPLPSLPAHHGRRVVFRDLR